MRLPNFMVYVVMWRPTKQAHDFRPHTNMVYSSRKDAIAGCRLLRAALGRGNCYVQMYGPMS